MALALAIATALVGCGRPHGGGACLDGGSRCAASDVPSGMRAELRGHRLRRYHWVRRLNRESGDPDVGIQAEWVPIRVRR